ncbi:MAG TPA: conserved phage C-terminal domain-containing protein [Terriglobales bacterium]
MREYGKVSPQFWIGETGKRLKKAGAEAQVVGLYLMTSPHANMLGLYYVPSIYIAHETGLGIEGASKGLQRCIEAGFCEYDEASEMVWVFEMAKYQIAAVLDPKDKRCAGVQNEYNSLPSNPYLSRFFAKYCEAFNMTKRRDISAQEGSPSEAPSKPLASQEQEQEQEQKEKPLSGEPDDDSGNEDGEEVQESDSVKEILAHLNALTGSNFRMVESNARLIRARLAEDVTVEQAKAVIDAKVKKWAKDKKMSDYLRPKTLFNATNFEQYLAELPRASPTGKWWTTAGFADEWEAMNAGCTEHNARFFRNGVRTKDEQ